jgi:hypothetical protein
MRNKHKCRKGFGLGQIMAMLLVVLPTIAFIVTFMLDYWSVMQADYKLKLIANQVSERADNMKDLSSFSMNGNVTCPNGTSLVFGNRKDSNKKGKIDIIITYTHNGPYLKNKVLSTQMHTYSYHDQNMSIIGSCQ